MKAKRFLPVILVVSLGFICMPTGTYLAAPGIFDALVSSAAPEAAPQEKKVEKDPSTQKPEGVSPIRPEIEQPKVDIWYCPHCGKAIEGKPWGKSKMYRPRLSSRPGEARKIRKHGGKGSMEEGAHFRKPFRRKMLHGNMRPHREGRHIEGRRGLAAHRYLKLASELGLSDDQKSKLKDLAFSTKMDMIDLNASLQKEQLELKKLMHSDDLNASAIKRQLEAVSRAQVALKFKVISSMIDARNILTEEQKELLEEKYHHNIMGCHETHSCSGEQLCLGEQHHMCMFLGHCDHICAGDDIERIVDIVVDENDESFIEVFEDEE